MVPPTSRAKDLLAAEPDIFETIYFEHAGSELKRAANLIRPFATGIIAVNTPRTDIGTRMLDYVPSHRAGLL
jgi:hypothetical protein